MLSTSALRFLKETAESANAPVLRALSGVVLVFADSAELATQNRKMCRALCEQVFELVPVISQEIETIQDDLPHQLLIFLDELQEKLMNIQVFIQEHLQRKKFGQFANSKKNAEALVSYHEDVRHLLEVFKLQTHVLTHKAIENEQLRKTEWITMFPPDICSITDPPSYSSSNNNDFPTYPEPADVSRAAQLPTMPSAFCGRSEQLRKVVDYISSSKAPVRIAVLGAGGIGKTTFATGILHDEIVVRMFGSRRFFVACDSADSHKSLLSVLAAAFGIRSDNPRNILGQLVQHLSASKTILVLDNFESPWEHPDWRNEVETVLSVLAGISVLTLIVTLRGTERPGGVNWSRPFLPPLGPLNPSAVRHIFYGIANGCETDPDVDQLLELVEGMPLGVTLVSNLAQYESPSVLLSRWANERTSLLARGGMARHSSLDLSIQISIECPRIRNAADAVRVLYVLSLLPDGLERKTMLDLVHGLSEPARCLTTLLQTSLAYHETGDRIRVLSPIRAYVLRNLEQVVDVSLLAPVYEHYMTLAHLSSRLGTSRTRNAIAACTSDIGNIESVLSHAVNHGSVVIQTQAVKAASQLVKLTKFTGLGNAAPILLQGLQIMPISGDKETLADCMLALAFLGAFSNDHGLLIEELVSSANRLYEEIGNVEGQIDCMRRNWAVNVTSDASLMYKALSMAEQLGDTLRQGQCHLELGQHFYNTGGLDTARVHFEQANDLLVDVDEMYQRARCLFSLGNISSAKGHPAAAMRCYRDSLELMGDIGSKSGAAHCYSYMGWVSRRLGDTQSAITYSRKAVNGYTETGFTTDLGLILVQLTHCYVEASMLDEAKSTLARAIRTIDKANPKWIYGRAQVAFVGGDVACLEGHLNTTYISYAQAARLFWRRNCNQELAELFVKACRVRLSVGDCVTARVHVITSIALSRRNNFVWELAAGMNALADVFIAEKEYTIAIAVTQAVLPMLNRLGMHKNITTCLERVLIADDTHRRTVLW